MYKTPGRRLRVSVLFVVLKAITVHLFQHSVETERVLRVFIFFTCELSFPLHNEGTNHTAIMYQNLSVIFKSQLLKTFEKV